MGLLQWQIQKGAHTPPMSKFFHFHAVFGKINRLVHPPGYLTTPSGKSWIRRCTVIDLIVGEFACTSVSMFVYVSVKFMLH